MTFQHNKPLVAVAMSGGVDSSVTAALLLAQGYPVIGVTMWLPKPEDVIGNFGYETAEDTLPSQIQDAKRVADKLGFSHYVIDLRQEFHDQIIRYFCDEYRIGRTPNPCVFCNPRIKFGLLFEKARKLGAEFMATGHYVKIEYDEPRKRYLLRAGTSTTKDQSYFLYRLTQEQLARSIFPLAGLTKDFIRRKAKEIGLHVAEKEESQENCFIAGQSYQQFLEDYLPPEAGSPGPIADTGGNILGQHRGIYHYTIGQRKGLGIALGTPRYVVAIHPETNTVVIGENHELFTREFLVRNLNFIAIPGLIEPMDIQVKIRYRNPATPATIIPGDHEDEVKVILETPQRAVTPGQSAVFYDGDIVVGGGVIEVPSVLRY